jgi:hypothetical protein
VKPSTIGDVALISPSDPAFDAAIKVIIPGVAAREQLSDLLSYSVLLVNQGSRRLIWLSGLWSFVSADERPGGMHQLIGLSGGPQDHILITPDGMVTAALMHGQSIESLPNIDQRLSRVATMRTKRSVTVSLDALVFEGGQLEGPDVADCLDSLNSRSRAISDLVGQIEKIRAEPDSRGAMAKTLVSVIDAAASPSDAHEAMDVNREVKAYAKVMKAMLDAEDIASLDSYLKNLTQLARGLSVRRKR